MSDEETISDDLTLESKTWCQMEKNIRQFGYREGASKGRDAVFQSGFDEGYSDGFQTGKALGQAKGILSYVESLDSEKSNACIIKKGRNIMEKTLKTPCSFCLNHKEHELSLLPFYDIVMEQEKHKIVILETVQQLKSMIKAGKG